MTLCYLTTLLRDLILQQVIKRFFGDKEPGVAMILASSAGAAQSPLLMNASAPPKKS
jgi:hypothetical protein